MNRLYRKRRMGRFPLLALLAVLLVSFAAIIPPAFAAKDVPQGRITGTVIEQTTGAPAPGMAVQVNNKIAYTDENGNYNRWLLPAGAYTVTLLVPEEEGFAAQPPQTITLAADETAVQHLFFTRTNPEAAPEPVSDEPTTDTDYQTTVVQPGEELWIPVGDSGAGVDIMADSLDETTIFQTRIVPPEAGPPPNPGEQFIGDLVEVKVLDADGNEIENPSFAGPIAIRMPFPPQADDRELYVMFFDTQAGYWIYLPTVKYDNEEGGIVRGMTDHVTLFALG